MNFAIAGPNPLRWYVWRMPAHAASAGSRSGSSWAAGGSCATKVRTCSGCLATRAALGVVAIDVGWQVIRHGTVMAHEGAHAIFGSLFSRNVSGIELNSDDGAKLTQLTYLPRLLWFLLWLAATVGAVAVGGKMLVTPT